MLATLKSKIIDVKHKNVIKNARRQGLDVFSINDFRKFGHRYDQIEHLMDEYRHSFTRVSALGGLTTGIGGFTTSVTLAGLDTIFLAIQLYRLSQRFAILNGFDSTNPLQNAKIINIYFESLGINAIIKGILKYHLLEARTLADNGKASETLLLKFIIKAGERMGIEATSKEAGRLIPFIGGLEGGVINYSLACKASENMKEAYKSAYFEKWHEQEAD